MRIGIIADTHIPEAGDSLPVQIFTAFKNVDLIFHSGDLHIIEVLDWLEKLAPVVAVRGNGDEPSGPLRPGLPQNDPRVFESYVTCIEGLKLGITHAFPLPEEAPFTPPAILMQRVFHVPVDVVICGHTHVALIRQFGDCLMVNPGSALLPNNLTSRPGTVGVLEISNGTVEATLIELSSL